MKILFKYLINYTLSYLLHEGCRTITLNQYKSNIEITKTSHLEEKND